MHLESLPSSKSLVKLQGSLKKDFRLPIKRLEIICASNVENISYEKRMPTGKGHAIHSFLEKDR
jgi:hypothetical protein